MSVDTLVYSQYERVSYIKSELTKFKNVSCPSLDDTNFDVIAKRIVQIYMRLRDSIIKPMMRDGLNSIIDHHKIASAFELSIMAGCFLRTNATKEVKEINSFIADINAQFAIGVALDVLRSWNQKHGINFDLNILEKHNDSFLKEHRHYLVMCAGKAKEFAIFSNSATWYFVEQYLTFRSSV